MPSTETPPNPVPSAPPPQEPIKVVTRRYGEIDHTELVHLLDSLEGDQAKSRFRESIYISLIIYLALAWLVVYGPKYVFRQGRIVPTAAQIKEKDRLTQMELSRDLAKLQKQPVPRAAPKLDRRAIEQLQAMQRANEAAKAARAPAQLPPAPQAQAAAPAPSAPPPPPMASNAPPPLISAPIPQPRATPPASIPDSPQPNFSTPQSARSSVEEAARAAARSGTSGRISSGGGGRVGQQGAGTGVEILSDTRGVDFTDYIKRLLRAVKAQWLPLIPEECYPPLSKEGTTLIRFTIEPNGVVSAMHLDDSTHDRAIDKAAWGSITGVGQFGPLPREYTGQNLELRIQFIISRNPPETE